MRRTATRLSLAASLIVAATWPGVAFAASSITGTVTFDGKVPALRPLAMDADPVCAKKHSAPVPNEALVLGNGTTMANILGWGSEGLPPGKKWPVTSTPVVLAQSGWMCTPKGWGSMVWENS